MMGLLTGSPFDADVEKATSHKCTSEDWALIMEICDKVGNSPQNAKECLRSITKRLNAQDPHIVILAITLLDACSNNCGKVFHLEIASRDFENQFIKLLNNSRSQPKIYEKLKALLKKWAEGDFKTDPQLNLIPSLFQKLKSDGHNFSAVSETPKTSYTLSKDPNVVSSAEEEEAIAKAIELSLKETSKQSIISSTSPSSKKTSTLYPSMNSAMSSSNSEGRKVKALYDFEAVEDNELTFQAGEIINILDDSDPNWWKGSNQKGEGLFPSNFVTADLSVEPEQFTKLESNSKKSVQFSEEVEIKTVKREPEVVEIEIDENKMDRLLNLLHEADPQSGTTDTAEMIDLEEQVTAMGPLIDAALEKVDKQHAQLTQLSSDLVDAMNLYHTLMREPAISSYTLPKMPPQQMVYQYPHPQGMHPQTGHPQHPQGMHPQSGHPQHPQGAHPPHPQHPQGAHSQHPQHPQGAHPQHPQHPQGAHPQQPQNVHSQAAHPQGVHPQHPQGAHPQVGPVPNAHPPVSNPQGVSHPQIGHPQGIPHSQVGPQGIPLMQGHPQGSPHPQAGHPQGTHPLMFNGLPSGPPQSPIGNQQPRFNTNIPMNESANPNQITTILQQFGLTPGVGQSTPESRPESQQRNQINIPFAHTGLSMPVNRIGTQVGPAGPVNFLPQVPGQQIGSQQPQFAFSTPQNTQRMM